MLSPSFYTAPCPCCGAVGQVRLAEVEMPNARQLMGYENISACLRCGETIEVWPDHPILRKADPEAMFARLSTKGSPALVALLVAVLKDKMHQLKRTVAEHHKMHN